MFLTTAEVHTVMRFDEYVAAVEVAINKALVEWGAMALEEIQETARNSDEPINDGAPRHDFHTRAVSPGRHLKDSFQVAKPSASAFGRVRSIVVWTANPNAIWQELGTRQRRRKKYKQTTNKPTNLGKIDPSQPRGVPASYWMRRALRKVEPEGLALVMEAVASIDDFLGASSLVDTTSVHRPAKTPGSRAFVRSRPFRTDVD